MDKKTHSAIKILEKYKNLVWPEVNRSLTSPNFPPAFKIKPEYKDLEKFHWDLTRDYPLRKGKYTRPTLLILISSAMGQNLKLMTKTATAMQLSEEWILISDDIEDNSLLRRGKPTLHRMYNLELAVNASDTLQTVMWKVLFDNIPILGIKKTQEIIYEFYSMIMRTELGQTADIKWFTDKNYNLTDEDWLFTAYSKSGYYSIGGPIRLGAIIANATPKQLGVLTQFGLDIGIVWQTVDDILDVTSDFKGLKQHGNDIFEGKFTIILGHLLRLSKPKDKKKLMFILQKRREEKSEKEVDWIIEKMHSLGSVDYAKKLANKYKEKAVRIFEKDLQFLSKQPYRNHLRQIIDFIVEREY